MPKLEQTEKNRRKKRLNNLVADALKPLGFLKTKDCWFVRPFPDIAQFMSLYFYRNSNDIRASLGWRIYHDTFPAIGLLGPTFDSAPRLSPINPKTGRGYNFAYNQIDHKEDAAAAELITFFSEVALPYFEELMAKDWAGLPPDQKQLLRAPATEEAIAQSKKLLGLRVPPTTCQSQHSLLLKS